MTVITLIYAIIVFAVGLYSFLLSSSNVSYLRKSARVAEGTNSGRTVSVLIPARNEEKKLPLLLESLVHQSYPAYEILIIDDNSTDRTWNIIEEYMEKYPGLVRGFHGKEKHEKVLNGKTYALSQIEPLAKGYYILATDADTQHSIDSIQHAVTVMEKKNLDMLSGYPEEYCNTFMANIITSAMNFVPVIYVPMALADRHPHEWLTIANGQFIMMKKAVLDELGGYEAIDTQLCDDVKLAKYFVNHKKKYSFNNISGIIRCNMYDTTAEAFSGISRSIGGIFPATLLAIIPLLFVVAILIALALSPLLAIVNAFLLPSLQSEVILSAIGAILFTIAWYRTARTQRYTRLVSLLWPLTLVMICVMYLYSYSVRRSGKSFKWKGRDV